MLDIKELRRDPKEFEAKLRNKIPEVNLTHILALDERVRALKTEVEELKSKRSAKKNKREKTSPRLWQNSAS